jgi:AraC-like DNA-binding protein
VPETVAQFLFSSMAVNDLIFGGKIFKVQRIPLISQCQSFLRDPSLLAQPYNIRSSVNSDNLRLFISAMIKPTLADKVTEFRAQYISIDEEARQRIQFLEEQNNQLERIIDLIQTECFYQKEELQRLFQATQELSMVVAQLQEKVSEKLSKGESDSKKKFEYKGDPLNGIISNLTKKYGKNVQDQSLVTVTAKTVYNFTAAKNVADLADDSWRCSADEPDQWICSDFGKMKVKPTHYTIRSHCSSQRRL